MTLKRSTGLRDKLAGKRTDKITNGDFATNTTGWTAVDSTLAAVSGELEITESGGVNPGKAYQDIATRIGRIFKATFKFKKGTSATGKVLVGVPADDDSIYTSPAYSDAAATEHSVVFISTGTTTRITLQSDSVTAGQTSYFDDVVVEEILDGFTEIMRNCRVAVYSGAQPASADNAKNGTKLYTVTKDGDGVTGLTWAEPSSGVVVKNPNEDWQSDPAVAGVEGWFRCYEEGDDPDLASTTAARFDGAINTSGTEGKAENLNVEAGSIQTINSFSYTQQAG